MANYVMPVVVGYAIVPFNDQWQSGFFTQVDNIPCGFEGIYLHYIYIDRLQGIHVVGYLDGFLFGGIKLWRVQCGCCIIVSGCVGLWQRKMYDVPPTFSHQHVTSFWNSARSKIFPGIVSWSIRSKDGTIKPIAAILLTAFTSFLLSLLPFNVLVQVKKFLPIP